MAKVLLTSEAREDIRDLDRAAQSLVLKALKKLETEPEKRGLPLGSKAGGNLTSFRKLVVGKQQYRVIYRVEADGDVCVVWVIGERADDACYELAMSRLETYNSDPSLQRQLQSMIEEVWVATEVP